MTELTTKLATRIWSLVLGQKTESLTPKPEPNPHHTATSGYFCCQGCVDVFITDPRKYLVETNDMIVCPTCLAEKPPQQTQRYLIHNYI